MLRLQSTLYRPASRTIAQHAPVAGSPSTMSTLGCGFKGPHGRDRRGCALGPRMPRQPDFFGVRRVQRRVEQEDVDARLAEEAPAAAARHAARPGRTWSDGIPRAAATRATWNAAASGLMCGSTPLADAKTRSAGHRRVGGSLCASRSALALVAHVGLQLRAGRPEVAAAARVEPGDRFRRWRRRAAARSTCRPVNCWAMNSEPTSLPSRS
jgi:hypothetical protein